MRKRTKAASEHDGRGSASLIRGLAILRAFSAEDDTLSNQDLMKRTGLPKATVSRLTATLLGLGYLHYDEALGRYGIGPATVALGYGALSSTAVVRIAQPLMQDLADETGVAVALGTRDGLEMVYLANCRAAGPVTLQLNVGSRLPILRTAMGLAYMAATPEQKREEIVDRLVAAEPGRAAAIRSAVARAVEEYRADGYIGTYGTWFSYINAIGVAFQPTDGSPLVSLTCGGIVDVISREACETTIRDGVLRLVERLRAQLAGADAVDRKRG
jgi:DNA-binding IclR family transcriptional regulator